MNLDIWDYTAGVLRTSSGKCGRSEQPNYTTALRDSSRVPFGLGFGEFQPRQDRFLLTYQSVSRSLLAVLPLRQDSDDFAKYAIVLGIMAELRS
jgi:hypothetical protein